MSSMTESQSVFENTVSVVIESMSPENVSDGKESNEGGSLENGEVMTAGPVVIVSPPMVS